MVSTMAKVKCGFCKEFIEKSSAFSAGLSYYCDSDHWASKAFPQSKCVGKKMPSKASVAYRAKKQAKPKSGMDREEILHRDNYSCRRCGESADLAVHHVVYKSESANKEWQDEPSNLITLCNSTCHLKIVHGNKKKYQPLCLQIIWLTYVENNSIITIKDLDGS